MDTVEECVAILIQTNVFADKYLKNQNLEEIESYYNNRLASYEFSMRDVHTQTDNWGRFFEIKDNTIIKQFLMLQQQVVKGKIQYYFNGKRIS